jgi:hypothetical protein
VPGRSLQPGDRGSGNGVSRRVASARHQWEDGGRRLEAEAGDPVRHRQLWELVEAVLAELRRRVGQRYSLDDLAAIHADAEDWVRDVLLGAMPEKGRVGVRDLALVQDAAFRIYSRGAVDYRP